MKTLSDLKVHQRILHSKSIGDALISLNKQGRRVSCGRFLIYGQDFIIDLSVWADSYYNNHGSVYLMRNEPEFCYKLLTNTMAEEQKYAMYNSTKILYSNQCWDEYKKDLNERL